MWIFFSPWNFYIDFYPCETDLAHGTFRTLIFVLGDSCVIFLYFKWVTYKFVKLVAGCFFFLMKLILSTELIASSFFGHGTCCMLIFAHETCSMLIFLFVKLVHGFFRSRTWLCSWYFLRTDFCSWNSLHVDFSLRESFTLIFSPRETDFVYDTL